MERLPTDEGASERQESLMDVGATLVAHLEASRAIEPRV
jgi:hypothetical protein